MKRAAAPMPTEHRARCIAVIVIRTGNLFCPIFRWRRCRRGSGKRLSSLGCPVFSPEFLPARFLSSRVGGNNSRKADSQPADYNSPRETQFRSNQENGVFKTTSFPNRVREARPRPIGLRYGGTR